MSQLPVYVLITPARNEAQFIEATIRSMIGQTLLPLKWVIVNDGSTDGTDEIVRKYAECPWIELVSMPARCERNFAGKATAFNAGFEFVRDLPFDVVGNLDADLSFGPDHFEYLLRQFAANPKLGVAGTPFREGDVQYDYRFTSIDHVSGACQLFRRECFEDVGGYVPIRGGGIDLVAVVTARMKGWQTKTFTERFCDHLRKMNSAMSKWWTLKFKWGQSDYRLGSHPAWQLMRCVYQMKNPPYIAGGMLVLAGYCWSMATRRPRAVSHEFARFRGQEQMVRLRTALGLRRSATT